MKKLFYSIIILSFAYVANASPLYFTRNAGQINTHGKADCRFTADANGSRFYFCADGVTMDFQQHSSDVIARSGVASAQATKQSVRIEEIASVATHNTAALPRNDEKIKGHVLKINFLGRTNFVADVIGDDEQEYKCNYFIGNDEAKWHTNVPNYRGVTYKNVWEGIDVKYYGADVVRVCNPQQNRGLQTRATLKYDVIVAPGADPSNVRCMYEGADRIEIQNGTLVIKTSAGEIIEQKPYVYQIIDGEKKEVKCKFSLGVISSAAKQSPEHWEIASVATHNTAALPRNDRAGSILSFSLGGYDHTKPLIIDPLYSTYLGGDVDDNSNSISVDVNGNAYVTGSTGSTDFPITTGAYQTSHKGNGDAFVTKLNASGTALIYSTYLGGGSYDDYGNGIAVDVNGNAYITGQTNSKNFPVTSGAYQDTNKGGEDVFVTKLNASGSALLYSTYLGGGSNEQGNGISIDGGGNAYVTGQTASIDFSVTPGAYQMVLIGFNGARNAFITKLNSAGTPLYSTFLGGGNIGGGTIPINDFGSDIAVDGSGNAYVTGYTSSSVFPTTQGAYQTANKGNTDAFVTKLNASGSALVYSTFLGGAGSTDWGSGISVDVNGNAYVTGYTFSTDFPVTPGAYQITNKGISDVFVTKLNSSGSALLYSTFLGGSGSDYGRGISVDVNGNAYVTGHTFSTDFPVSADAYQTMKKGNGDIIVTKLNASGTALLYSTFLGGSVSEYNGDISVGGGGNAYVTGNTGSTDFPVTSGAYQTINKGGTDAFVTRFDLVPAIGVSNSLIIDNGTCPGTTVEKTFTIRDSSPDISLVIKSMTITGADASSFQLPSSPVFPDTIFRGTSKEYTVRFTATSVGTKTATLNLFTNDEVPLADTLKKIILTGIVDSVGLITFKKSVNYGTLTCSDTLRDSIITVRNTGTVVTTITPSLEGNDPSQFSYTPASATIPIGGTAPFTVRFQPGGNNTYSARIRFTTDACGRSDTTYLTGIKSSDASISIAPLPKLLFDTLVCPAPTYRDSIVRIKNTGTLAVTLNPPTVSGPGFSLLSPRTSITLAPQKDTVYKIRFTPTQGAKTYNGSFSVTGSPCNVSQTISLVGVKDSIKIFSTLNTLDFDTLTCGDSTKTLIVKVKNVGSRTLTVNTNNPGSGFTVSSSTKTVANGDSTSFTVTFKPSSTGTYTATLHFNGSLCGATDSVVLKGVKQGEAKLTAIASLRFDTLRCENVHDTTITIKNDGAVNVQLDPAQISGSGFTIINNPGVVTLAPTNSQQYQIRFATNSAGNYAGTFTLQGNPCNVTVTIQLDATKDSLNIIATPPSIVFDSVPCGVARDTTMTLSNTGSIAMALDSVKITGNSFTLVNDPGKVTLASNASKTYTIRFYATMAGTYNATLNVNGYPCAIALSATLRASCAAGKIPITFSFPASTKVALGDHTTIPVAISRTDSSMKEYDIEISFDPTMLYVVRTVTTGTMSDGANVSFTRLSPGLVKLHGQNNSGFSGILPLVALEFKALLGNTTQSDVRFKTISTNNSNIITQSVDGQVIETGCEAHSNVAGGTAASLEQNQPNPFSQSSVVSYQLSVDMEIDLSVYDLFGRKISTIMSGLKKAGTYEVTLTTENIPAGFYVYQLRTERGILAKKLNVVK